MSRRGAITAAAVSSSRLKRAKWAFTTRRVQLREVGYLLTGDIKPKPGDLVLAKVRKVRQPQPLTVCFGRP